MTPHHLALSDEWVAGVDRWSWDADPADRAVARRTSAPYSSAVRVNPPLRAPTDALACLAALADGTVDAVATDHAPHAHVDKDVEFGLAANGISGIETALGLLLEAVAAGRLTLARAIASLTAGPAAVLGARLPAKAGLIEGAPADLVVFDAAERWSVSAESLHSRGKNSPLIGRDLAGRVLLTIAQGRVAHVDTGNAGAPGPLLEPVAARATTM